jgi:lipopolysaccharide biosynthesis glycosyltransferase
MKLAIVTRADSGVHHWIECTHQPIKEYAKKCGADFFVFDHDPVEMKHLNKYIFWRILKVNELFDQGYDRILHIDTDVLVTKNAPNIFDEVPYDHIGVVYEDKGTRKADRIRRINSIQSDFGDVGWKTGYLNEGVMLFSKCHRELFTSIDGKWVNTPNGPSQGHFGWKIHKHDMKVIDLGYKYNHMSMFSESWNGNKSRFDSYFIHYAGGANFPDKGNRDRMKVANDDKIKIYGND